MEEQPELRDLGKYKNSREYRKAFKLKVIEDMIASNESDAFIERKHGIGSSSLHHFKQSLLSELGYYRILDQMKEQSNEDLSKENEALKKALELAMMKVQALEVLIDVAEDQLNVDIRKKGESKQSK